MLSVACVTPRIVRLLLLGFRILFSKFCSILLLLKLKLKIYLYFSLTYFCFAVFPLSRDASEDDLKLWLPTPEKASVQESEKTSSLDLDAEMAIFLLTHAGDQFCYMVQTEKEAKTEALASVTEDGDPLKIAWKRVVQGVREMCDVCETTLFNFHWACGKCGYVVCIDCYKSRRAAKSPHNGNCTSGKDDEKEVRSSSLLSK